MIDHLIPSDGGLDWLQADGPLSDVVLSTRVRLARNLTGLRFGVRSRPADRASVLRRVQQAAEHAGALAGGEAFDIPAMPSVDRLLLWERHLVSRELVGEGGAAPRRTRLSCSPRGSRSG